MNPADTGGGAVPALIAYFKAMGDWNNLGLLDLWAAILVVPWTWHRALSAFNGNLDRAAAPLGTLLLLLATVLPVRVPPSPAQWAFGRELEKSLAHARQHGERVLIDHGTSALIRAGYVDIPLDRANSILELSFGSQISRAKMTRRIESKHYDRIYLGPASEWYGPFRDVIRSHYKMARRIRESSARRRAWGTESLDAFFGYQAHPPLMNGRVDIMVPRDPNP